MLIFGQFVKGVRNKVEGIPNYLIIATGGNSILTLKISRPLCSIFNIINICLTPSKTERGKYIPTDRTGTHRSLTNAITSTTTYKLWIMRAELL